MLSAESVSKMFSLSKISLGTLLITASLEGDNLETKELNCNSSGGVGPSQ